MLQDMLYNGWVPVLRVVLIGTLSYLILLLLLRASGKRTLSKMNAFDAIVTIALGSTLSSALISKDVALAEAAAAFALLVGLQLCVTWLSVRSDAVDRFVKSQPTLLAFRGRLMHDAMRRERVTEGEVMAAVRAEGKDSLRDVAAVVLETQGELSVLTELTPGSDASTLAPVSKPEATHDGDSRPPEAVSPPFPRPDCASSPVAETAPPADAGRARWAASGTSPRDATGSGT